MELVVDGAQLQLTLHLPDEPVRGGCVALHPAGDGSRQQPLMTHLAHSLTPHGIAVLLHDRREKTAGEDVPLRVQALDALAVTHALRAHVGDVPIGMWAWSQGTWAAALATSMDRTVAFLVLVASVGVSPAEQMRHGTAEHLRRAGFDELAVAEMLQVRAVYEDALRGRVSRLDAQRALDRISTRQWRQLAWLPERVAPGAGWADMDFDPAPVFQAAHCPVLAVWGEDDPWVPVAASEEAWRRVAGERLTVLRLPGVGHGPEPGDPRYTQALLAHVLAAVER